MLQGSGLWWWEDFAAVPASRRRAITGIVIVLGFLLSGLLIGGLSYSKIGLVDENDLPQYVGTEGHIAFSQIPRLLLEKTEVGQFGQSQRFRPVYYLTRLIETALWGLEGGYWYSWRVVMFGAVIAAMLWLYTQCTGLFLGAILTAYTLSFAMWVDIWTRSTGPSEQYAVFGSAIFAVGAWQFVERWRAGEGLDGSCLAMAAGAIIAMGSKENMLLLELPLLAALAAGLWHRRIGRLSAVALSLAIAFGVWVASSIALYFVGAKVEDIYGNSVHTSLLGATWMRRVYAGVLVMAVIVGVIGLALWKIGAKDRLERYRPLAWRYSLYASAIAGVFVFNFLFYTGMIPAGARYDFPAVLALPALLILLLDGLSELGALFGLGLVVKRAAGLLLAVALIAYTARAPWELPAAVKANVARNSAFEAGLRETQRVAGAHPEWPIFIKSFNFLDYEVIQALGYFFIARSINNPRYLVYVANPYGEPRNAFQSGLDQALQAESNKGMLTRGYLPLAEATTPSNGKCYVVVLRKPEQFALDQANGKNPVAGENCAPIPLSIYWDDNSQIHFDPPKR
ncbi:hypothetical protein SAMN05444159_6123 [Bradyrhizobium lablabi]|uniref:Glycosyltransferase RgtA/B/C/D-like domain-containing protein n=1 Tax=Bradyrhizobium lablabi TaxID=722472 RepID=A0A1M7BDX9_9BRAD|nr:hypothetical protein [Bradyrhizobium lablabi]SHL53220.1 hypothetical protein SAMN05444159_6123 [Bradyrhizobium lablabi]